MRKGLVLDTTWKEPGRSEQQQDSTCRLLSNDYGRDESIKMGPRLRLLWE